MLQSGDNCSGSEDIFGSGDCLGCVLYRDFIFKIHAARHPPLCPYNNVLYLGYERAIIATLEDSSHELLEALQEACYGSTYGNATEELQAWWGKLVHRLDPDDDPLYELPRWTDPMNYQAPSKTSFMMTAPFFTQLGNSIPSCNVHGCPVLLTIIQEALLPLVENVILDESSKPPFCSLPESYLPGPHNFSLAPLGSHGQNKLPYGSRLLSNHPSLGYSCLRGPPEQPPSLTGTAISPTVYRHSCRSSP